MDLFELCAHISFDSSEYEQGISKAEKKGTKFGENLQKVLKQAIDDTDAVADYADMAVTDMSDNANKMGTDMALLQSAYQGFAKQNYTMLDNLKLGYGGTATEMARLINDSGVLGEAMIDLGDQQAIGAALAEVGFAKMVEAIHVVQTEMGITGTTAKEASTTISGSVASMKAAWENLLVGVANEEADFEQLIHDFVDTVGVTAENIIPRIDTALNGAAQLIDRVVPIIVEKIPELVSDRLPQMLESGVKIIQSITTGMLNSIDDISNVALETVDVLVDGIIDALPDIIVAGTMLIFKLADGLIKAIPDLVARIPEIVKAIWDGFASHWPDFVDVGKSIVNGIIDGLSRAWNTLTSWIGAQPLNIAGETVWVNGSHAAGLDYVPYDGYVAKLHRGEMVLTRDEALAMRNGAVGASVNVVQNIYSRAMSAAALMEEALHQQERAVYLGA